MTGFRKAVRRARKLRMSIQGPAGSGKTRTALEIATRLGGRVAVIDTEHSSADVYAPADGASANPAKGTFDFDVLPLETFAPQVYMDALYLAAKEGYGVVIIDSLSHAWIGEGGILSQADDKGGKFNVWKDLTPQQNAMMETILTYPGHVLVTMRTKTVYETTKSRDANGKEKTTVEKIGTAPVQKDGTEYEFDIVIDIDGEHSGRITKTRCSEIEGKSFMKPGEALAAVIKRWLDAGEAPAAAPPAALKPAVAPAPKPDPARGVVERGVEIEQALAKSIARYPHAAAELHKIVEAGGGDVLGKLREACKRLGLAEQQAKLPTRTPDEAATVQRLRDTIAQLDTDGLAEAAAQAREIVSEYGGLDGCTGADLPALVSQVDALATSVRAGRAA